MAVEVDMRFSCDDENVLSILASITILYCGLARYYHWGNWAKIMANLSEDLKSYQNNKFPIFFSRGKPHGKLGGGSNGLFPSIGR
jgi:hypothetical protein